MISAISTAEEVHTSQSHFFPVSQKIWAAAMIVVITSGGMVSNAPLEQCSEMNQYSYCSTDIADGSGYTNRHINLWWDGDSVMSSEKADNLMCLLEIEQLQNNWNGNGAKSFSLELLSTARKIVTSSSIQASIFPTARDSIQFEYENDLGDYLEIEIFESGRIKVFSFDHNGLSATNDISADDINGIVGKFYGRDI